MTINLHIPNKGETLKPSITVVGVGGAGGNAVNNMIAADLEGVNFVVANTDAQALESALTDRVIQLGTNVTQGLGAGASPDVGRAAAEEALDEIAAAIEGSHMVFITAGMGGGTGTGAAPVIAQLAKENDILTVGVVTKPFQFEGSHRMLIAENGLDELQRYVDTMIVIPNQNLFRIANERTTFADAFRMADEVLHSGVRGVTDLMVMPGLINLDFADIRAVMKEMGKAMMGTGEAEGEKRAIEAAEAAISNPLLDDVSMKGARGVLINITGGNDMTLFEVDEAANRIRDEVDPEANIIFGSTFNNAMEGRMRVSVVSTGIESMEARQDNPASNQPRAYSYPSTSEKKAKSPQEAAREHAKIIAEKKYAERTEHIDLQKQANEAAGSAKQSDFSFSNEEVKEQAAAQQESGFVFGRRNEQEELLEATTGAAASSGFVAPAAAQPATKSYATPNTGESVSFSSYKISPSRDAGGDVTKSSDSSVTKGLFQKFAGALGSGKEEEEERPNLEVVEKPKVEVKETSAPAAKEEDYLDIPAFLRRQAN